MILGLLPAIRGGIGELAKTGQHSRLVDGYLRPYTRAFTEVRYFSYLEESLDRYAEDPDLLRRVPVFPGGPWHPWLYTGLLPFRHSAALRGCDVLRVFQITGVVPAVLAKRRWGIPFVTTYGFWYSRLARSRWTRPLRQFVEVLGLATADAVIVTTPALHAHVARRIGEARLHLIPNGVDVARFHPGTRQARRVKDVLYVGRLSPEKNLDTLLEAAGKLAGRLRLTFVGHGPLRGRLEAHAQTLGVPVEFRSVVDHRQLPGVYAAADAFVLPSLTEGHAKVLLEAMSAGLACVASNVGGNPELVTDGETGLLFDPRDATALAGALERVLDDDVARRLGARARARVVEAYDLAPLVEREIEVLRRLAASRGGARRRYTASSAFPS